MNSFPKTAIVYLSYNSASYLDDMFKAFQTLNYPKDKLALIIVDNPHSQFGSSAEVIKKKILENNNHLPETVFLPQEKNLGFAGGNNVGIKWAIENGFEYAFLHNQDGYLKEDCLEKLTAAMENDQQIGCAQSLIILDQEKDKVNSAGNSYNYLGFGFINNFGKNLRDIPLEQIQNVGYASGAGLIVRTELMKKFGLLNEDLFAYHEDVEYSLRLKFAGYKTVLVRDAIFYHKYVFSRDPIKFYFMERNRFAVLLIYYSWATLILLLPMLIIMEFGLIFFCVLNDWLEQKIKAYNYWFNRENFARWMRNRKQIQEMRRLSDKEMIKQSSGKICFGDNPAMNHPLLTYVANPVMVMYKSILQTLIFW